MVSDTAFDSMSSTCTSIVLPIISEELVDKALVSGISILEARGHHIVTIKSLVSDKKNVSLVMCMHEDLVIVGVGTHKAEQLMTYYRVIQLVN